MTISLDIVEKIRPYLVDINDLCHYQLETLFTPEIVEKYKHEIDWYDACMMLELSEKQLYNYAEYFTTDTCWYNIAKYQKIGYEFIKKYKDRLDLDIILLNQDLNLKTRYKIIKLWEEI